MRLVEIRLPADQAMSLRELLDELSPKGRFDEVIAENKGTADTCMFHVRLLKALKPKVPNDKMVQDCVSLTALKRFWNKAKKTK